MVFRIRSFLFSAFVLTSILFSFGFSEPQNFHDRLSLAGFLATAGHHEKSDLIYDRLVQEYPHELIVFSTYTHFLIIRGDYSKALSVSQKALENERYMNDFQKRVFVERIRKSKSLLKFEKISQGFSSWGKAKTYDEEVFSIRTNLNEKYARNVLKKIAQLMLLQDKIFASKLKQQVQNLSKPKVLVIAGAENIRAFEQERKDLGERDARHAESFYLPDSNEIVVTFRGYGDWCVLAHELSHFMIRKYVKQPSRFLDEGMAEYLSMKLEPESCREHYYDFTGRLNWKYDQGEWQHFLGVFQDWEKYNDLNRGVLNTLRKDTMTAEDLVDLRIYDLAWNDFYLKAWTIVSFFMETQIPEWKLLFKEWLEHEREEKGVYLAKIRLFFLSKLDRKKMRQLDHAWGRHALGL